MLTYILPRTDEFPQRVHLTRVHGLCTLSHRSPTNAHCSTHYSYVEFTYARTSLEAINWRKEYDMDNITDGTKGLMAYNCGTSADPCMEVYEFDFCPSDSLTL